MASNKNEILNFIPRKNLWTFFLVTMLFLIWGIPNNLNDILIKQFMKSFELTRFQAGLVQSAFYLGYFILAIPSGVFMKRYSYKSGLVLGLWLFALGCILFWPAAVVNKFWLFLFALFVIASGLTFLESGANTYIVELGSQEAAERRLNFSQAFNPIGAMLGVLVGTVFIFSGVELNAGQVNSLKATGGYEDYLKYETMRVVWPYLFLALLSVLWSVLILLTRFPVVRDEYNTGKEKSYRFGDLLNYPHFYKGLLSQFFYCGAQTCTWSYFIQYVEDYTGQPEKTAGYFLIGTLFAFGVGRFAATYLMKFVQPNVLMGTFAFVNFCLVTVSIIWPDWIGVYCLFFTSFFMSLMYPTNFALSLKGLDEQTKLGGSVLVMAIVGGAVFPPLMGLIAEKYSMSTAYIIPMIAYLYIIYYGFIGSVPVNKFKASLKSID